MKDLETIYPPRFFSRRKSLHWRAEILCASLRTVFNCESRGMVLDVGCATGDLVAEWRRKDFEAWGVEGSQSAFLYSECPEFMIKADITIPEAAPLLGRFDLLTCFEVLEHIPEGYAEQTVDNLCSWSDRMVITAALPGQGGHHHVNCQPYSYWKDKFERRGFVFNPSKVEQLRIIWNAWKEKRAMRALFQNLMVFERGRWV